MKTPITLALFASSLALGWGQGQVDFRNQGITFRTLADRAVYLNYSAGIKLTGTNYVAGLWFVPGIDPNGVDGRIDPHRGMFVGLLFRFRSPSTSDANKGTWAVPPGVSPLFTFPGVFPGQTVTLQVRVWDWTRYASFADAWAAGEYGVSEPFLYTPPQPGSPPDQYYMENLRAFPNNSLVNPRTLWVNDIVASEGSNGVAQATFTVTLVNPQTAVTTVDYVTEDGTALAGEDYVAASGTLTFQPGELTKTVTITLTADAPPEPDETFKLRLQNPTNGILGKSIGTCTITEVRVTGLSVDTSVSFNTIVGRRYTVEWSGNAVTWEPVAGATDVLGTGEIVTVVDRGSGCQPSRAYRARLLQ
jgi:hypothetical protein